MKCQNEWIVTNQFEDVDENVVVRLQDELGILAILRDPPESHDGLVGKIPVRVDEILLYNVSIPEKEDWHQMASMMWHCVTPSHGN